MADQPLQSAPTRTGWRAWLVVIGAGAFVVACGMVVWAMVSLARREREEGEALKVLDFSSMVSSSTTQAWATQRDGLLTGDPKYKQAYDELTGPLRSHMGIIDGYLSSPEDRDAADMVRRRVEQLLTLLDNGWTAIRPEASGLERSRGLLQAVSHDQVFAVIEDLTAQLERLTSPRYDRLKSLHRAWPQEQDLLAVAFVGIGVSAAFVLTTGIASIRAERRRRLLVEKDLTESELIRQRRELLVEQSPLAVIVWDLDFRIREWNPAAERIFGWKAREALGLHGSAIIPAAITQDINHIWKQLLTNRGGWRNRNQNLTKSRGAITCEWYNQPLIDSHGDVAGVISLCQDVTLEEQARSKLNEAYERYERVINGTSDGFWEFDYGTKTLTASPRLLEIFGLSAPPDDWMSWWRASCHPDDLGAVQGAIDQHLAGLIPLVDIEFRIRNDGGYRWLRTRCSVVRDAEGRPRAIAGSTRDVNQRRLAEIQSQRDAAFLRLVLDTSPAGVRVADVADRTLFLNREAAAMFGLPEGRPPAPDELDAKWKITDFEGRPISPENEIHRRIVGGSGPLYGVELGIELAGGASNRRLLSINAAPLHGPEGRIEGVVYCFTDVTDRELARQRQAALAEELQHSRRIEAVGNLASGVAHDFNNVLTAIYACVESARAQAAKPEAVLRYLELIEQAAKGASDITQSLLAYARKGGSERRTIDLRAVVADAVKLLRRLLPESITLGAPAPDPEPLWVFADPTQVQQVLLNLAVNARDAMPEGGVLSISLTAEGEGEEAEAVMVVSDTGVGIAPDEREHIFEPFYTTKPRGKGTGLGLSVVQGIVVGHGGSIEVSSAPGSGSAFSIRLPLVEGPSDSEAGPPASASEVTVEGEAIIAEDDGFVRSLIGTALRSMGFSVTEVADGRAAIECFARRRGLVRLVVMDLGLPVLSGFDAIQEIRRQDRSVPIIAISGNMARPDSILPSLSVQLLAKPFRIAELRRAVHAATSAPPPADVREGASS